jgi:phosphatidate phosphatase APP1
MSVVSDIDDTIKVSEIPAGADIVLRNTFLRDYMAVEGMRDRHRRLGDVSLHYVSGSPWQMFGLLHTFLIEKSGFPEGAFHMKSLRKNLLDLHGFLHELRSLVAGKQYTKEQKLGQISELMEHLPARTFTLIGDRESSTRRSSASSGRSGLIR